MPVLSILSGCCGRPKETMFVKMLWEDTFRTNNCHVNVARWHSSGSWGWIKDQVMETHIQIKNLLYFEGRRELIRGVRRRKNHDE